MRSRGYDTGEQVQYSDSKLPLPETEKRTFMSPAGVKIDYYLEPFPGISRNTGDPIILNDGKGNQIKWIFVGRTGTQGAQVLLVNAVTREPWVVNKVLLQRARSSGVVDISFSSADRDTGIGDV